MKKLIYILLISLIATISGLSAQEGQPEYLFNDFQKSLIYYKDGRVFGVKVNYSLARNAFMFIDENDNNNIKLFAEPDMVRTLKIGNRIFQLAPKGLAQERLNQEPYLAVTFRGRSRPQGNHWRCRKKIHDEKERERKNLPDSQTVPETISERTTGADKGVYKKQ